MTTKSNFDPKIKKVTIIGAGTIGISWTGLFLANGLNVTVTDIRPDLEEATRKGIDEIIPTLKGLGF